MKKSYTIGIGTSAQFEYITDVRRCLYKTLTVNQTDAAIDPLEWYIQTGRFSGEQLRLLFQIKPYIIAKLLAKHQGTTQSAADAILSRISKQGTLN